MRRLADIGHQLYVQILDNKFSTDFKITIFEDWCANYQLVTPNVHRINIAERDIRTFKGTFFISYGWSRSYLPQFYVVQPLGSDITDTQPSSSSHTQPKHVSMVIFQQCL